MNIEYYNKKYLFFIKEIVTPSYKTLAAARSVHFCEKIEYDELFLERHDKTRYQLTLFLKEGKKIPIISYDKSELEIMIKKLIIPVNELYEEYLNKN
jgi:hypothetical protein